MRLIKAVQTVLARCGIMAYRRKFLPIGIDVTYDIRRLFGPVSVILDVGANQGQTALQFARGFPGARIYSFEPVPGTFSRLKANTAGTSAIRCFPVGLGAHAHVTTIRVDAHEHNSLLNAAPAGSSEDTATLSITTGDAWALTEGI